MTCPRRLAPLLLLATGCGYSFGVDDFGPRGRTIAVEVADNRSYRQDIAVPLTRQIHVELAEHTNVRQTSVSQADAILRVTITDLQGVGIVRGGNPPLREGALDFTVDVELVDRATGRPLRKREIRDRAEYATAVGETLESATAESISDLARKIVLALEDDF